MGQTESRLKGSYTFAYMIDNIATTHSYTATTTEDMLEVEKEEEEEEEEYNSHDNNDQILKSPETYGLRSTLSSCSFLPPPPPTPAAVSQSTSSSSLSIKAQQHQHHHHRDSGYVSPSFYGESIQLINDLGYIDNIYYNNNSSSYLYKNSSTRPNITTNTNDQQQCKEEGGAQKISFTDVMLTSPSHDFREIYLAWRSIRSLDPNMGMLTMIRKLDLSNNYITELPDTIGYLHNLEVFNISKNQLNCLPDAIGYLSNLEELDASYNQIQQLTPCISYLEKLKTLSLAYNQIHSLSPTAISGLVNLISLDLTQNPIRVLPAEISQLQFLRRMRLEDCPFIVRQQQQQEQQSIIEYALWHDPPSLLEVCGRSIKGRGKVIKTELLPQHLQNYLQSAKSCTSCHGPYFESCVLRGRLMEKTDLHIPLEYSLCSAHWSTNDDRIQSMFSSQPTTSSHNTLYRPNLPCLPKLLTTTVMETKNETSRLSSMTAAASSLRNKRSVPPTPAALQQSMDNGNSTIATTTVDTINVTYDDINETILFVPTTTTTNGAVSSTPTSTVTSKLFSRSSSNSGKSNLVMNLTTRLKKRAAW